MDRIKLDRPVIVEGKYDKIKLISIIDADIITTDGFGVFKKRELSDLIRRVAEKNGIFVLTDSDGGGLVIRNYFNSILPKDKVTHLYIPQIHGKEKRKTAWSKQELLGVEGIDAEILREIFRPYGVDSPSPVTVKKEVTKLDFFGDKLSGGSGSAERRKALAREMKLPDNLSANALLAAVNMLYTYDQYKTILDKINI